MILFYGESRGGIQLIEHIHSQIFKCKSVAGKKVIIYCCNDEQRTLMMMSRGIFCIHSDYKMKNYLLVEK
jgi:hypothetical protein